MRKEVSKEGMTSRIVEQKERKWEEKKERIRNTIKIGGDKEVRNESNKVRRDVRYIEEGQK